MIPPEPDPPEPDPPEPTVPEYTYGTSSSVPLGGVYGTLYTDIQYVGVSCKLTTTDSDSDTRQYTHLILYEDALGDSQCYFVYGNTSTVRGILGSNASVGLTVPTYLINKLNGTITQSDSEHIDSATPSDYFTNVVSGNFTLVQRS